MEFTIGILGNLVSDLISNASSFLFQDLTDNITWKKWKAEHNLSKNQSDFLDRYAETLITLKKQQKPAELLQFYCEKSVIGIIHEIWYGTTDREISEIQFVGLTKWFTLDQRLTDFSPKDELNSFLKAFGVAVHLNRTSGEAGLFQGVSDMKETIDEFKAESGQSNKHIIEGIDQIKLILDGKTVKLSDFDNIRSLIERRKELTILARDASSTKNYISEIKEIENKIMVEKGKIDELINEITQYSSEGLLTKQIKEARELIWKGRYGKAKHLMIEMQQEEARIRFLHKLGVPPEYIDEVYYEIETGHVSSDDMVYYYLINFSEDSPIHILEEIPGIEKSGDQYYLQVYPWDLETGPPEMD